MSQTVLLNFLKREFKYGAEKDLCFCHAQLKIISFNEHEKAGNEVDYIGDSYWSMEKQREHRKNSFQNITAVFSVACMAILIQILIDFFKFQALDISVTDLLSIQARYVCRIVVSIPVYLEVTSTKLYKIYIIGGNYCKLIIKVRNAKK